MCEDLPFQGPFVSKWSLLNFSFWRQHISQIGMIPTGICLWFGILLGLGLWFGGINPFCPFTLRCSKSLDDRCIGNLGSSREIVCSYWSQNQQAGRRVWVSESGVCGHTIYLESSACFFSALLLKVPPFPRGVWEYFCFYSSLHNMHSKGFSKSSGT